jgi:riboflavin synthase
MFSGIIETIGRIQKIQTLDAGFRYTVASAKILRGTKIGDSISHDGICLTVIKKGWGTYQRVNVAYAKQIICE